MLATRIVRDLVVDRPIGPGRPAFIAAGSGFVRAGAHLYVVADDDRHLASFPAEGDEPGRLHRLAPGDLPVEVAERKGEKPDLEALAVLPAFPGAPHGAVFAVGSGSSPHRTTGFVWALARTGSLTGRARPVWLGDLYGELIVRVHELNVEGAAVVGDAFRLLQRGNNAEGENAVVDLDLSGTLAAVAEGRAITPRLIREVRPYDLGRMQGVKLTFTDASPLPDRRMAFSAVAEDSGDAINDGPSVGSVIGVMEPDGEVSASVPLDRPLKVEGVLAELAGEGLDLLLVTDADDPATPSPLIAARMDAGST